VQTEQKTPPKAKLQNAPAFTFALYTLCMAHKDHCLQECGNSAVNTTAVAEFYGNTVDTVTM